MPRARILCISLSPIGRDARVLRQIAVLSKFGDVTTVGYGVHPRGAERHIRVPDALASLPQTVVGVALLGLRRWRRSELSAPAVRFARKALADRRFDLVVSNDARVLALAFEAAHGAPIWADMHEWAPEERTHILSWRLLVAPLMRHLCRTYLPRVEAVTTVAASIAELYAREFDVPARVMRNSTPWRDLTPSPREAGVVRLVHSGGAVQGRSLETMIDAVRQAGERFTLDLYLVPSADGGKYLRELESRAAGCHRIAFREPVPPNDLPVVMNRYDVGVFWIPPTHTNARLTLPNKFFDYVQARLAIAVGPTVEMETLVRRYDLGVVSTGFDIEECLRSLTDWDDGAITAAKEASGRASRELSFDEDEKVAEGIIARLLTASGSRQS